MITEICLSALPDGARVPLNISELYEMYEKNLFMAMRYMGLINIIATTLTIPVFFSLYGLHRERHNVYAGLLLLLYIAGYAIFIAGNSTFALLELSSKYELASSENMRSSLLSAGEALFAKGASHTPGTFPGFFISELACFLFCVILLNGKVFSRITAERTISDLHDLSISFLTLSAAALIVVSFTMKLRASSDFQPFLCAAAPISR